MIRLLILVLLASVSSASYATCASGNMQYAAPINIDLSDKLSPATPEWTGTFSTQYSGSFHCTTGNSKFGYTSILSTNSSYATVLGFDNNKYNVRAEITDEHPNIILAKSGSHSASELNTHFTVRFSLVSQSGTKLAGNMASLSDVLFVTDLSGMSLGEIILWPLNQLGKILQWLFNGFNWPYDKKDMFGQPMIVKYAPKLTTCAFDNAGLTVTLPTLGISQIAASSQPGLTPFTLNMRCESLAQNNTSDRAIEMFLSSNNLLSGDSSVLVDNSSDAAKGVGLRVVKREAGNTPVIFSTSTTSRGSATAIFSVAAGGALSENFTLPMAVYYYPYAPQSVTQGKIKTSATLNIIYP